jgi:hypothetical protein
VYDYFLIKEIILKNNKLKILNLNNGVDVKIL